MAHRITINQNKGSKGTGILVIRSDATGFVKLNSNTANTHTKANTAGETVSAMYLAGAFWTLANTNGSWTINRGANTIVTLYGASGYHEFWAEQTRLEIGGEPQANIVFTLASGPGSLVLKFHKTAGA